MVHFFSSVMFVLIFLVIVGLFSSPLSFPYLIRESEGDIRAKPEYDREEFEDDRRKNNTVIVGLDPAIKERDVRLKAEYDNYFLSFPCLARESVKEMPGVNPNMT